MGLKNEEIDRINRYLSGNHSEEDEQSLIALFSDETRTEDLKKVMKEQWYELLGSRVVEDRDLDHILHRIHYDINLKRVVKTERSKSAEILLWAGRVAAMLLLPVAIFFTVQTTKLNREKDLTWVEIKAPAWTRARFTLPDNSMVWLNSNSSIRYRGDFIADRTLLMEGEAFFSVVSDKTHPFNVKVDDITITATGTKFNVASYKDERNLEVVLEEGILEVSHGNEKKSVEIEPNELLTYDRKDDGFTTEYIQPQKYVSWTEGKLVFRNDPIDVIARRLGRWYNVDVEIKGDNFDQSRLRATFDEENLEEVLWYLQRSLPIRYEIIQGGLFQGDEFSKKKVIITLK